MLRTARADGNARQEAEILQAIKNGFKTPEKPSESSTAEFFKVNDRKLNALIKSTTDDLKRAETAILRMSNDKYRKAIYNAQVYANTGAGTYEKAVDMACRDMLQAGLNCVEYKNGARHTLPDYAEMAVRTANKRAYLYGEGEKRAEWGISTVVVNQRQGGCPDCAKYIGQVFIDDVYSNGKEGDGNYPLLSTAIEGGLFHPRCKDSTSTYYEGITTLKKVSKSELSKMKENEALEQQKFHAENQAKKCDRISKYSLDKDNKRIYQSRAEKWQEKADEIREKLDNSVANSGESGIISIPDKLMKSYESGVLKQKQKASKVSKSKAKIAVKKKAIDYSKTGSNSFLQKTKIELYQTERIISGNPYETAVLYNSNGERVFIKKGKKDKVTFTKTEISKMKNGVLTHNHPNGTVFSPDDINMLRRGELSEIRACNGRGTYVLRNASEWDDNIPDFQSICDEYWNIMNEIGTKYRDLSAKEGKPICYYLRQMDEDGLNLFSERHGLEFVWEKINENKCFRNT